MIALRLFPLSVASACAVCFGNAANAFGFFKGIAISIALLLGVTFSLLGGIALAMFHLEKNRAAAERGRL